jgi:transcriptional regulator with XRE-family HTH domain
MEYRYIESGLDNVIIEGMEIQVTDDGKTVYSVRHINDLHHVIAHAIITHSHGMSGRELRFLRTEMGCTQDELAEKMNVSRLTIGRWERGETTMNRSEEFMFRWMAAGKLGIDPELTAEQMAARCGWAAEYQPIKIDGTDPEHYRLLAA